MYRPPAYNSGKVLDEKLIFNKWWPDGYERLWQVQQVSSGYGRVTRDYSKLWCLWLVTAGYERLQMVKAGYGRLQVVMAG